MTKVDKAIRICIANDFFDLSTLFLSLRNKRGVINLIGISRGNQKRVCKHFSIDGINIDLYILSCSQCMSLILSNNQLIPALFHQSVCLKDELDISRTILQNIMPALKYNNMEEPPALKTSWIVESVDFFDTYKELSITFEDITSDSTFLSKIWIPMQQVIQRNDPSAIYSLQFYDNGCRKYARCEVYFKTRKTKSLTEFRIHELLYLQATEANCQRLAFNTPLRNPKLYIEQNTIYKEVASLVTDFQNIVLAQYQSNIETDTVITELIYAYLLSARIFFDNYAAFEPVNHSVYDRYVYETASDTVRYLISHRVITSLEQKISKENLKICIDNALSLYENYALLISDWKEDSLVKEEYLQFESQLKRIKNMSGNRLKIGVFFDIVNQLFHSFDISKFYRSYIPYSIKFLGHEI